jgi:membrane protein implicated in regulation of membrane protease activity
MDPFLPAPQPRRWRRGVYAAALVIPFTAMQLWAIVLLTTADLQGPLRLAFVLAAIGSVVAVVAGWRWVARSGTESVPAPLSAQSQRYRAAYPQRYQSGAYQRNYALVRR